MRGPPLGESESINPPHDCPPPGMLESQEDMQSMKPRDGPPFMPRGDHSFNQRPRFFPRDPRFRFDRPRQHQDRNDNFPRVRHGSPLMRGPRNDNSLLGHPRDGLRGFRPPFRPPLFPQHGDPRPLLFRQDETRKRKHPLGSGRFDNSGGVGQFDQESDERQDGFQKRKFPYGPEVEGENQFDEEGNNEREQEYESQRDSENQELVDDNGKFSNGSQPPLQKGRPGGDPSDKIPSLFAKPPGLEAEQGGESYPTEEGYGGGGEEGFEDEKYREGKQEGEGVSDELTSQDKEEDTPHAKRHAFGAGREDEEQKPEDVDEGEGAGGSGEGQGQDEEPAGEGQQHAEEGDGQDWGGGKPGVDGNFRGRGFRGRARGNRGGFGPNRFGGRFQRPNWRLPPPDDMQHPPDLMGPPPDHMGDDMGPPDHMGPPPDFMGHPRGFRGPRGRIGPPRGHRGHMGPPRGHRERFPDFMRPPRDHMRPPRDHMRPPRDHMRHPRDHMGPLWDRLGSPRDRRGPPPDFMRPPLDLMGPGDMMHPPDDMGPPPDHHMGPLPDHMGPPPGHPHFHPRDFDFHHGEDEFHPDGPPRHGPMDDRFDNRGRDFPPEEGPSLFEDRGPEDGNFDDRGRPFGDEMEMEEEPGMDGDAVRFFGSDRYRDEPGRYGDEPLRRDFPPHGRGRGYSSLKLESHDWNHGASPHHEFSRPDFDDRRPLREPEDFPRPRDEVEEEEEPLVPGPVLQEAVVVSADKIFDLPGRSDRPSHIVIILRGLPGSGKSYVAKLIKDKEVSQAGQPPRILALDSYFINEVEKTDPVTGRRMKQKVEEYEYDEAMESSYRKSMFKSFNKTLEEGFFPMVIVDAVNHKISHFDMFWSNAKMKGFEVYVVDLLEEVCVCVERNIHGRTEDELHKLAAQWEDTPVHFMKMDVAPLLSDSSNIAEIEMEEDAGVVIEKGTEESEEPLAGDQPQTDVAKSRWEDASDDKLDKLDGFRRTRRLSSSAAAALEEDGEVGELSLTEYITRKTAEQRGPCKKRVRWADLEAVKEEEERKKMGFVMGSRWSKVSDEEARQLLMGCPGEQD